MLIDVSQVKRFPGQPQDFRLTEKPGDPLNWLGEELVFAEPISIKGTVEAYKEGTIFVQGKLRTGVYVPCSRCLKQIGHSIEEDFSGEFLLAGKSLSEMGEEFSGQYYIGDFIQLDGLIRENIYLSLPMQFLCSQECQGLCPQCGVTLDAGQCNCEHEQVDPRLEVLKQLLKVKD